MSNLSENRESLGYQSNTEPSVHEQQLVDRVLTNAKDAPQAALELFEQREPRDLERALAIFRLDQEPVDGVLEVIDSAWDQYRHLRDMSWD